MNWQGIISWLIELLNHYGLGGIFILMVLENLGIPLPTEVGFIAGQSMVIAGRATYLGIFFAALFGKTLGSIVTYFAGKYFADKIRHIHEKSSRVKRAQETFAHWMKKYGDAAVFVSRVVGYVRPWSSYLAGIGEIKFLPFIIYNVLGSAVIIALSMVTLGTFVELWRRFDYLRPYIVAILLISFFGFWIYIGLRSKFKKKKS